MSIIKNTLREYIYNDIKKKYDKYFVIYYPINLKNEKIAKLEIVFTELVDNNEVINVMEEEFDKWISKYPLPIMVISFDAKGDIINLKDTKNYLAGYLNKESNKVIKSWSLKVLPEDELIDSDINLTYKELSYSRRTCIEKNNEEKIRKRVKENKEIKIFFDTTLLLWLAIVIAIALLGLKSFLVGAAACFYSIYRAIRRFCFKKGCKTKTEKKEEEKMSRMKHYYYHCERNPEGFRSLIAENFEEDEKERIKKERESIKN